MQKTQDEIFWESEGNNWFLRNKDTILQRAPETDLIFTLLDMYSIKPRNAVEIGASNGYRMAAMAERFGIKTVAVELSAKAIKDGRMRYPNVRFIHSKAHAIPIYESFDMVIVHFVLHWIARKHLMETVAEIDRLCADNSYLIVGDFAPSGFYKIRYHHLPKEEVFTFKQNYADIFLASGLYYLVGMLLKSADTGTLDTELNSQLRGGLFLMRKSLDRQYVELSL